MQVKVGRKIYDTEKAEYIGDQTVGYFGEDYGFKETLYRKGKDDFFIVGLGGSNSPYPEEKLAVLDMEATEEWLRRVLGDERADEVLEKNKAEAKSAKSSKTTKTSKAKSEKSEKIEKNCKEGAKTKKSAKVSKGSKKSEK